MAALLVLAGAMINGKVKEKKDAKRRKVLDDQRRHQLLQAETDRKNARAAVERNYDSEDGKEHEALPRYEDVIDNREGSSSSGDRSSSGLLDGSEAPPEYGSRVNEQQRHPGV